MEYKKTYKGFWIWMICFIAVLLLVGLIPVKNAISASIGMRLINNVCAIAMAILAFIIYESEYVYWYNGISYEDALKADSERRREYAWKHFQRFGTFAVIHLIISVAAQLLGISMWVDFAILVVGMIGVAFSTMNIKL